MEAFELLASIDYASNSGVNILLQGDQVDSLDFVKVLGGGSSDNMSLLWRGPKPRLPGSP